MSRSRILTTVLIVSLAINLLFIGALIGHWARERNAPRFPPHFGWMMRGLDEQTRENLRPLIRRQARELTPLREKMRDAQLRFNAALTNEPLDEKALDQSLNDLQEATAAFQAIMHNQMITVIKQMDLKERRRIARYLRHRGPGDMHRGPPDDRGRH